MGSGVTWEKEEDEALSRAWVAASEDAITGIGQKASKLWSRVFDIYVKLIIDSKDCTSTACTARWGTASIHRLRPLLSQDGQMTTTMKNPGSTNLN